MTNLNVGKLFLVDVGEHLLHTDDQISDVVGSVHQLCFLAHFDGFYHLISLFEHKLDVLLLIAQLTKQILIKMLHIDVLILVSHIFYSLNYNNFSEIHQHFIEQEVDVVESEINVLQLIT